MRNHKLLFLFLASFWLIANFPANAAGIALIQSADYIPYRQASDAFETEIGIPVTRYRLDQPNIARNLGQLLRQQQPELIFALGSRALEQVQDTKISAPLLFAFVLHPPSSGEQMHATGISMIVDPGTQLQLLQKVAPRIRKIGMIYNPMRCNDIAERYLNEIRRKHLAAEHIEVNSIRDAALAIRQIMPRIDALWLLPDATVISNATLGEIIKRSLDYKVPVLGFAAKQARAGILLSLTFDSASVGKQAALIGQRILQQGRSVTGKIYAPKKVHAYFNRNTARILGLSAPRNFGTTDLRFYE